MARADIETIRDYTRSQWGTEQARKYLSALEDQLFILSEQPTLGPSRPELRDGLRCFPFESHTIFYVISSSGITVVRILHQKQDPATNL